MNKPPLGLTPRHFWLRDRVIQCIAALSRLEMHEEWERYRDQAMIFAEELLYATQEWEKYYK